MGLPLALAQRLEQELAQRQELPLALAQRLEQELPLALALLRLA